MSRESKHVLIIDDVDDDTQILENMLSEEFTVSSHSCASSVLDAVRESAPGVIILNPAMHELNTLSIINCVIELNPRSHVIFLSNLTTLDDKIQAYEQGADDFIAKPYNPVELYHKVERHVEDSLRRVQLMANAENARTTAFAAMESNSEMGIILRYMEEITSCNSYTDLGISLAQSAQSFGVEVVVQVRGLQEVYNFGCANDSFEAVLLTKGVQKGKIIEGAYKIIINDKRISILIKNAPAKSDPKYGRLKDNIAMMIGATDARVTTIDLVVQLEAQRETGLKSVIGNTRESMHQIRDTFNAYEKHIWEKIQSYREETEGVLISLGLSEEQEETLMESLDQFVEKVTETDATKELIESSFAKLLSGLDDLN
ncbi:hypothetical protein A9Q99_27125 [Gammaproteobacteria bacterium 45_16_T64]|nr:hypothetical protein A9Q99_27125 [Gammaproteobacteria bacterium 45_16_T64]